MSDFLGKVVRIYPGDTVAKWGKVLEINPHGVVFEVTKVLIPAGHGDGGNWQVGEHRFIAYSAKLSFSLPKEGNDARPPLHRPR